MNELIKIGNTSIGDQEVQTVSARELYEFLEVSTRYNDWISNRIKEFGFIENKDYLSFTKNSVKPQGGRPSLEYYITLDMAKHLGMLERSEKGRQIRDYFIECEKQLKETLSTKDSLLLSIFKAEDDVNKALAINAYETEYVRPLEQFKEEATPKVEYHDNVLRSEGLLTVTQIAKDHELTSQRLNKILHEEGVQFKRNGQWLLYKEYQDKGYTKSYTYLNEGNVSVVATKWTQKGRHFIDSILQKRGVLANIGIVSV